MMSFIRNYLRRLGERYFGAHDLVGCDGKFAHTSAGGVVNCIGNGGGNSGDRDFADTARAERVKSRVGDVEHGDVDVPDVGVDGNLVFGEVGVDSAAESGVDMRLLVE